MGHLFAGAFGVYRNSTGHRHVPTDPEGPPKSLCLRVSFFASLTGFAHPSCGTAMSTESIPENIPHDLTTIPAQPQAGIDEGLDGIRHGRTISPDEYNRLRGL
jgi:hypothetical protein